MLRPEAKKDDAAFTHTDFGERDLSLQLVLAEQPSRAQDVLLRIPGDNAHVRARSSRKRGTVDEVGRHRRWQRGSNLRWPTFTGAACKRVAMQSCGNG